MLPASAIVKGAMRWLNLLRRSTFSQAWLIFRTDSRYSDLTQSQYASALELLRSVGILCKDPKSDIFSNELSSLAEMQANQVLFERIVEYHNPAWLTDSDILIPDPSEIPEDAANVGRVLGLGEYQCYRAIRNVHGRVDLAKRKLVGDAGELELLHFLEKIYPGGAVHVAKLGDGYGYDIALRHLGKEWHLEVKSTTRRGRLTIHLSRNEYEVSLVDPDWRLVVVGLDADLQMQAVATLVSDSIITLAPKDMSVKSRWQSASFEVAGNSLINGLCLDEFSIQHQLNDSSRLSHENRHAWFGWLPVS